MKNYSLLVFLFLCFGVGAHEVRPAYLSIVQESKSQYQVTWKLPAKGNAVPKIQPIIPKNWTIVSEKGNLFSDNLRRTYLVEIDEPLKGSTIHFKGQKVTLIDVLVNVKLLDGTQLTALVKPIDSKYTLVNSESSTSGASAYLWMGVEHILFGIDHLLFVLALLLITSGFSKLLKTITAFTIAHSITLSLAALGVFGLPSAPVEAVIALSIVFLAVELVNHYRGKEVLTAKYPWLVAFAFGLLHGFGFAGALAEIGLPQNDIPLALLLFNIGVELGQIMFVLAVMMLLFALKKTKVKWPVWSKQIPVYTIGAIAAMWLIERVGNFFT